MRRFSLLFGLALAFLAGMFYVRYDQQTRELAALQGEQLQAQAVGKESAGTGNANTNANSNATTNENNNGVKKSPAAGTGASPTPFACNADLYLSLTSGGSTTLQRLVVDGSGAMTSTVVGTSSTAYNATAFNPVDGFIYAIAGSDLLRIGANDEEAVVGAITGVQSGAFSGAFLADGTYLVNGGTSPLQFIDVTATPPTVTQQVPLIAPPGGSVPNIADIARNPLDGYWYAFDSGTDRLVKINPNTGTTSYVGPAQTAVQGSAGAAFFHADGRLYLYQNDGKLFLSNTATGVSTLLDTGDSVSGSDGASCVAGVDAPPTDDPTAPLVSTCGVSTLGAPACVPQLPQPGSAGYADLLDCMQSTGDAATCGAAWAEANGLSSCSTDNECGGGSGGGAPEGETLTIGYCNYGQQCIEDIVDPYSPGYDELYKCVKYNQAPLDDCYAAYGEKNNRMTCTADSQCPELPDNGYTGPVELVTFTESDIVAVNICTDAQCTARRPQPTDPGYARFALCMQNSKKSAVDCSAEWAVSQGYRMCGSDTDCGAPTDKITLCHAPDTSKAETITVDENSLKGHLSHGDSLGSCTTPAPVPVTFNCFAYDDAIYCKHKEIGEGEWVNNQPYYQSPEQQCVVMKSCLPYDHPAGTDYLEARNDLSCEITKYCVHVTESDFNSLGTSYRITPLASQNTGDVAMPSVGICEEAVNPTSFGYLVQAGYPCKVSTPQNDGSMPWAAFQRCMDAGTTPDTCVQQWVGQHAYQQCDGPQDCR
ncbi:hypothetical protein H6771_01470 [Candidatus Peribacteria bacterium]|nr:hypothetical protein [Candidatus Peribacteria bacterium]